MQGGYNGYVDIFGSYEAQVRAATELINMKNSRSRGEDTFIIHALFRLCSPVAEGKAQLLATQAMLFYTGLLRKRRFFHNTEENRSQRPDRQVLTKIIEGELSWIDFPSPSSSFSIGSLLPPTFAEEGMNQASGVADSLCPSNSVAEIQQSMSNMYEIESVSSLDVAFADAILAFAAQGKNALTLPQFTIFLCHVAFSAFSPKSRSWSSLLAGFGQVAGQRMYQRHCVTYPFPEAHYAECTDTSRVLYHNARPLLRLFSHYATKHPASRFELDGVEEQDNVTRLTIRAFMNMCADLGILHVLDEKVVTGFFLAAATDAKACAIAAASCRRIRKPLFDPIRTEYSPQPFPQPEGKWLQFDEFLHVIARVACEATKDAAFDRFPTLGPRVSHFVAVTCGPLYRSLFAEDIQPLTQTGDSERNSITVHNSYAPELLAPLPIMKMSKQVIWDSTAQRYLSMINSAPVINAKEGGTLIVKGELIGVLGRGVWAYLSCAGNSMSHIPPTDIAVASASIPFVFADDDDCDENQDWCGIPLRIDRPGSTVAWDRVQIMTTVTDSVDSFEKCSQHIHVHANFSSDIFCALANTPEDLLLRAIPGKVGTLEHIVGPLSISEKSLLQIENIFVKSCRSTNIFNGRRLYSAGWQFFCNHSLLRIGPCNLASLSLLPIGGDHLTGATRQAAPEITTVPSEDVSVHDVQYAVTSSFQSLADVASREGSGAAVCTPSSRQRILMNVFERHARVRTDDTTVLPCLHLSDFLEVLIRFALSHGGDVSNFEAMLTEHVLAPLNEEGKRLLNGDSAESLKQKEEPQDNTREFKSKIETGTLGDGDETSSAPSLPKSAPINSAGAAEARLAARAAERQAERLYRSAAHHRRANDSLKSELSDLKARTNASEERERRAVAATVKMAEIVEHVSASAELMAEQWLLAASELEREQKADLMRQHETTISQLAAERGQAHSLSAAARKKEKEAHERHLQAESLCRLATTYRNSLLKTCRKARPIAWEVLAPLDKIAGITIDGGAVDSVSNISHTHEAAVKRALQEVIRTPLQSLKRVAAAELGGGLTRKDSRVCLTEEELNEKSEEWPVIDITLLRTQLSSALGEAEITAKEQLKRLDVEKTQLLSQRNQELSEALAACKEELLQEQANLDTATAHLNADLANCKERIAELEAQNSELKREANIRQQNEFSLRESLQKAQRDATEHQHSSKVLMKPRPSIVRDSPEDSPVKRNISTCFSTSSPAVPASPLISDKEVREFKATITDLKGEVMFKDSQLKMTKNELYALQREMQSMKVKLSGLEKKNSELVDELFESEAKSREVSEPPSRAGAGSRAEGGEPTEVVKKKTQKRKSIASSLPSQNGKIGRRNSISYKLQGTAQQAPQAGLGSEPLLIQPDTSFAIVTEPSLKPTRDVKVLQCLAVIATRLREDLVSIRAFLQTEGLQQRRDVEIILLKIGATENTFTGRPVRAAVGPPVQTQFPVSAAAPSPTTPLPPKPRRVSTGSPSGQKSGVQPPASQSSASQHSVSQKMAEYNAKNAEEFIGGGTVAMPQPKKVSAASEKNAEGELMSHRSTSASSVDNESQSVSFVTQSVDLKAKRDSTASILSASGDAMAKFGGHYLPKEKATERSAPQLPPENLEHRFEIADQDNSVGASHGQNMPERHNAHGDQVMCAPTDEVKGDNSSDSESVSRPEWPVLPLSPTAKVRETLKYVVANKMRHKVLEARKKRDSNQTNAGVKLDQKPAIFSWQIDEAPAEAPAEVPQHVVAISPLQHTASILSPSFPQELSSDQLEEVAWHPDDKTPSLAVVPYGVGGTKRLTSPSDEIVIENALMKSRQLADEATGKVNWASLDQLQGSSTFKSMSAKNDSPRSRLSSGQRALMLEAARKEGQAFQRSHAIPSKAMLNEMSKKKIQAQKDHEFSAEIQAESLKRQHELHMAEKSKKHDAEWKAVAAAMRSAERTLVQPFNLSERKEVPTTDTLAPLSLTPVDEQVKNALFQQQEVERSRQPKRSGSQSPSPTVGHNHSSLSQLHRQKLLVQDAGVPSSMKPHMEAPPPTDGPNRQLPKPSRIEKASIRTAQEQEIASVMTARVPTAPATVKLKIAPNLRNVLQPKGQHS